MIDSGHGVLPELRLRNPRAEVAGHGSHVAVQQLVPRPRERVGELVGVLVEAPGDRLVDRVRLQRQVRREHHRRVPLRGVVRVRHRALGLGIRGRPLLGARRAGRELVVVLEQVLQVPVVPLDRLVGPRTLQPTGERVGARAGLEAVLPAQALVLHRAALGLRSQVLRIDGAVALAERVAADDERHRLLVVHGHAGERLADVACGRQRVRVAVRTLGVDVDETHLHGAERAGQLPVTAVALVAEPGVLGTPEDLLGLPRVGTTEAEAEGLEPHRLERDVSGEDQEVSPRDLLAVLLLDGPEQPAGLVEADVVRPAVERREALRALTTTAPTVGDAVRAGGVPGHPDEERSVVAVVRGPPVLRRGHHGDEVLLQRVDVEGLELLRVVEVLAQGIGEVRVLVEDLQGQLVRPPVLVRHRTSRLGGGGRDCWAFAFRHGGPSPISVFPSVHWLPRHSPGSGPSR